MIRFTEGKEECDLEKTLFAKVGINERRASGRPSGTSPAKAVSGADDRHVNIAEKKTTITLATVMETQQSVEPDEDEEEDERSMMDDVGMGDERTNERKKSPLKEGKSQKAIVSLPQQQAPRGSSSGVKSLQGLSSQAIRPQRLASNTTALRKSTVAGTGREPLRSIRRAPLPKLRTAGLVQHDEDFPDASRSVLTSSSASFSASAIRNSNPSTSPGPSIPKARPGLRPVGLAASKAPSAKHSVSSRPSAGTTAVPSAVPLSAQMAKFAAAAKKHKIDTNTLVGEEVVAEDLDRAMEGPITHHVGDSKDMSSLLATPPRPISAAVPTGSSIRRGPGNKQEFAGPQRLGKLLAQARARVAQDYTNISIKRTEGSLMMQEKLVLRALDIDFRGHEQLTLTCRVIETSIDAELAADELISCIVPLHLDEKDGLAAPLRHLKHLTLDSDVKGNVVGIYRPWRLVKEGTDPCRPVLVCSGLVTLMEVVPETSAS